MTRLLENGNDRLLEDGSVRLLESGAAGTPISFSGPVPNEGGKVGIPYELDVSVYFSGTETPFTYSLQAGTLPDGLSLNTGTGVISGTPTTEEEQVGVVVRGTDTGLDTADTNGFTIEVTIPNGSYGIPITDARYAALGNQGFAGTLNDRTLAWLQDAGATSRIIPEAWRQMLNLKGYNTGFFNLDWANLLEGQGYSGTLNEMEREFWIDGGILP